MAKKIGVLCCFCGQPVEKTETDPCRLTVEPATGKWQVWFSRGACFKERLAKLDDAPGFFDPAHF